MSKSTLPTSGYVWGLSMIAPNEAVMGAIIGMAKLWGCVQIGFDAISRKKKPQSKKDPVQRTKGKKVGRPKGRATAGRKPTRAIVGALLAPMKVGQEFLRRDVRKELIAHGWPSQTATDTVLGVLLSEKVIKRAGRGKFRKLLTVVQSEAA